MSNRKMLVRAVEDPLHIDPSKLKGRRAIQIDFGSGIYSEPATEIIINDEQVAARFVTMSEEAYEALPVKDPATFYFLYED